MGKGESFMIFLPNYFLYNLIQVSLARRYHITGFIELDSIHLRISP